MKPFRERNPVVIGFVGLAVLAAFMVGAFRADRLPIIGSGDVYYAEFAEIGGLKDSSEVRIAGVSVGKVQSIELAGDRVKVAFKMDKGTFLGDQTTADIRVRTLLGAEYLGLQPEGGQALAKGGTIPLDRTDAPYNVIEAFSELSDTTKRIDTQALAESLKVLGDIAASTPEEFRGAIDGVSRLSRNLAARDREINTLLVSLDKVARTVNSRDTELVALFKDSDVLFRAVAERRESISQLLQATQQISTQLRGLVTETRADLKPALKQLDTVTDMLVKNQASLEEGLDKYPAFTRVFSSALGTGPWFDAFLATPVSDGSAQRPAAASRSAKPGDGLTSLLGQVGDRGTNSGQEGDDR